MLRIRFSFSNPVHLVYLALAIREAFSFWSGHPYDLEVWIRNGYFVSQGVNPYAQFLPPVPGLSIAYLHESMPGVGYLPLWPVLLAGLYQTYAAFPVNSPYVLYFLIKQPIILADVYLGVLIHRAVIRWGGSTEDATRAMRYWALFPYTILVSAVWGQFDALVVVLAFDGLLSRHVVRRYLETGAAIFLKWYPLVLLPYYFLRDKGLRRWAAPASLAVPLLGAVTIFAVADWDYPGVTAMTISASHGGGLGMTYINILQAPYVYSVLGDFQLFYIVLGYLWIPGVIVAGYASVRRFPDDSPRSLVQGLLLVAVAFYLTRYGVYEQYLMYLLPFFIVDVFRWHPERRGLLRFVWLLVLGYFLVNNDFLVRFLGPVDPGFVDIAYAADNYSSVSALRGFALYVFDVLITITYVQLAFVFANPSRDPRPWPLQWAQWIRRHRPGSQVRIAKEPEDSTP